MKSEINKKLFAGDWVFSENNRMAYKLDKQGSLIFNCMVEVTEKEKLDFTIEALVHLGIDKTKAEGIANYMEPMK